MFSADDYLEKYNLTYEKLTPDEKQWLFSKVNALAEGQLSVEKIRDAIKSLRMQTENELTSLPEIPENKISFIFFFFPIYGLIKMWFDRQKHVELKARLRVYIALEVILTAPERQQKEIDQALSHIAGGIG